MQSTQAALRLCGKCRTLKNARAIYENYGIISNIAYERGK
jgi:hypothetical protein